MSDDEVPKHRSSKKTRQWCRGKKGVEHRGVCMRREQAYLQHWRDLVCEVCGKRLDYWAPSSWSTREKPDWVTF